MDHEVEALTVHQRLCPEAHADLDQHSPPATRATERGCRGLTPLLVRQRAAPMRAALEPFDDY